MAFSEYPDERAIPFLVKMTVHKNNNVQYDALKALVEMSRVEFYDIFLNFLLNESTMKYARGVAAMGLARLGDERVYDLLYEASRLYGKEDQRIMSDIREAYDELTLTIRKQKPDFQPPGFVEQDKENIQQNLQNALEKDQAEKERVFKEKAFKENQ
jgi:HEAT repeat protein